MKSSSAYYARNKGEKGFDCQIRSVVIKNGTNVETALYLQNQTILNMLRHIEDTLKVVVAGKYIVN